MSRSLGKVEAMVMFFLELDLGQRVERKWNKEVPEIGPGQDQLLEFDCRVDTNGQPYSILSVQVYLLLKGQSIEYRYCPTLPVVINDSKHTRAE